MTAEGSTETGIPVGIPVAAGTIDAWSEAVSAGVRDPGEAMVMYGTTIFFVAVCERPLVDRRLEHGRCVPVGPGRSPAVWRRLVR